MKKGEEEGFYKSKVIFRTFSVRERSIFLFGKKKRESLPEGGGASVYPRQTHTLRKQKKRPWLGGGGGKKGVISFRKRETCLE